MLCGPSTLPYAVFVYLYICVFVFLYLRVWRMGISFLIPLNNPLFKNMPHVGSFWHLTIWCICVFCICIFVFARLTPGIIIFNTLEQSPCQKYATYWVILAPHNMLCMCICVFCYCICLFLCICHHHMIEEIILFTAIFQMRCLTWSWAAGEAACNALSCRNMISSKLTNMK